MLASFWFQHTVRGQFHYYRVMRQVILLSIFGLQLPYKSFAITDIELITPAARIQQRIDTLEQAERNLYQDREFITRWYSRFSREVPAISEQLYRQRFLTNNSKLEQIINQTSKVDLLCTQYQKELDKHVHLHERYKQAYLHNGSPILTMGYFTAVGIAVFGGWQALPFYPITMAVYMGLAAGTYHLAKVLHGHQREQLRLAMHASKVSMEDTETRVLEHYHQRDSARKNLYRGRLIILQNIGLQLGAALEPQSGVSDRLNRHYLTNCKRPVMNDVCLDIETLFTGLKPSLDNLSEQDMLILTLADNHEKASSEKHYQLVRDGQIYYMGLPVIDNRGQESLYYLRFPDSDTAISYLDRVAQISQSTLYGFMSFSIGSAT